ncbi:MAG: glutamine synthetase family protein [Gammaproteobacteria bacterium]
MSAFPELDQFLERHPDTRHVDVFLNDLNGVERGKRIEREALHRLYSEGMPLPGSMFALDVLGGTIQESGLGFDEGDADRPCKPLPGSLVPVPWQSGGVAQVQVAMFEPDGRPFFADPRHVLTRVLDRFHRLNLTPVVALEYEFYFVDRERLEGGMPQPPRLPVAGRREFRTQINSMTDLNEFSKVLSRIDEVARLQGLPSTSALAEYGPGQFEVNLEHRPDALRACDEAMRFKRVVRSVAREQGWDATFLPKPYRDMAGSGLHVHVSVLDAAGQNIFACPDPAATADDAPHHGIESSALRHGIGGMLRSLADGMAICAPGPNSYRRFRSEAYVPLIPSWSINNRGTAVRIPLSDATNRRIEHRLAGADANPYLVVAWALAGIHHGIAEQLEPAAPIRGNAYREVGEKLPLHWASALERFGRSEFAAAYFGRPFRDHYAKVKQGELDEFNSYVTPLEMQWYLGAI